VGQLIVNELVKKLSVFVECGGLPNLQQLLDGIGWI
jgi:hypothetical protein